ncbi:MAG: sulfatase [Phycisphaerae bacterium]
MTPNILFLFPDQWRWDWLGCEQSPYGRVPVRTPNIDALAARGMRFTQCRTNSPLCAPGRACLATGRRYHRQNVPDNGTDLDPAIPNVFQALRAAGYRVATSGKNDLHKKTTFKGLTGWTRLLGQYGFTEAVDQSGKLDANSNGRDRPNCSYTSHLHAQGLMGPYCADYDRRHKEASYTTAGWPGPLPRRHYTDDFCGQKAMDLLGHLPADNPWMLWVNFPGPHDPWDPPAELAARYDGINFPPPVSPKGRYGDQSAVNHDRIRRLYAAECEGIDEWVGRLTDAVAARGELEHTLIVFASDHGEMLGDHGRFTKHVPEEGSVHVPLILAGPGVQPGVSEALVELIDLAATCLDIAGVDPLPEADARSLVPTLEGRGQDHRALQVSELLQWRSGFDGRWKLVQRPDGVQFDLQLDPAELTDVAAAEPDRVGRLKKALEAEAGVFAPRASSASKAGKG